MTARPFASVVAAVLFVLMTVTGPVAADTAADAGFAGTYRGDSTALTIQPDASGGYVGELSKGDLKFPVTAAAEGETLTGRFVHAEESFPFTVTRSGDAYQFKTGGTALPLTFTPAAKPGDGGTTNPFEKPAAGPTNPFEKSGGASSETPAKETTITGAEPATLQGAWTDGTYVMEFQPGGAVRVYATANPQQAMTGTYSVAGNALTATVNGQTQASTFVITGDTMQLTDAQGKVETVRRVAAATPGAAQPEAPADDRPAAGAGLQGAWTDGQYAMSFNPGGVLEAWLLDAPQQKMQGTYTVNGNSVSVDFQGEKDRFTYVIHGNQMTTTDSEGSVEVVRRLDPNAAPPMPGDDKEIPGDELQEIGDGPMVGNAELIPPIQFPTGGGTDRYKGSIQGTEVRMTTTQQNGFTLASITDPDLYEYRVKVTGQSGILYDPQTGGQVPVEWATGDDTITLTLMMDGERIPIEFTPVSDQSDPSDGGGGSGNPFGR